MDWHTRATKLIRQLLVFATVGALIAGAQIWLGKPSNAAVPAAFVIIMLITAWFVWDIRRKRSSRS